MQNKDTLRKSGLWQRVLRTARRMAAVVLVAVLAVGCENGEGLPENESAAWQRLGVSALYTVDKAAPETKAASATTLPEDAAIGFFQRADGSLYPAKNNLHGAYNAAQRCWLPDDSLWIKDNPAQLAVYYPYSASQTAAGKLNLTAAERNPSAPQEIWYSRFEADKSSVEQPLSLTQAYCRMQIAFVLDQDISYRVEPYLYKLVIGGGRADTESTGTEGIYATATLDFFGQSTAVYTGLTKDYTPLNVTTTAGARMIKKDLATTAAVFDLLMIPTPLTGPVTLGLVIGGDTYGTDIKEMTLEVPAADFGNALEAGKQYRITIHVKGAALSDIVTAVKVETVSVINGSGTTTADGQQYWDMSIQ